MGLRIAFTSPDPDGSQAAALFTSKQLDAEVLSFDVLLHLVCRKICDEFGFAYSKDHSLLEYIRTWATGFCHNIFLSSVLSKVELGKPYVIADLVRLEDAEILRELNFVLVKIQKPVLNTSSLRANKFEWDYEIRNCGAKPHFEWQLSHMLRLIGEGEHKKHPHRATKIL
jgi:hypothetical protein